MTEGRPDERDLDLGTRLILGELRDLRAELRTDRERSDAERRRADEAWREDRRRADETLRLEREQSEARFQQVMRENREQCEAVHAVGLAIVRTLNRHTRILLRIDRRLGGPDEGARGGNGRG